jgi:hypothetical protein
LLGFIASASDMLRAKCCGSFISRITSATGIGTPEDDFDSSIHNTGLLQQRRERSTAPLGGADAAREPRESMIAAAFDRVHNLLALTCLDISKRQRHRLPDQSGDLEIPLLFVNDRLVVCDTRKNLSFGVMNEPRFSHGCRFSTTPPLGFAPG